MIKKINIPKNEKLSNYTKQQIKINKCYGPSSLYHDDGPRLEPMKE